MKNKEFQRRLVYDTLILLGVFTVILFMCRLWPLILLCILGLFAAMIRLLFLSRKETVIIQSVPQEPAKAETEKDLQQLAFELAIRRITERVTDDFPQARWVWKSQHAKEDILSGRDTAILLNQAGGYREAIVHIQNLQVAGITYGTSPEPEQEAPEVPEPDEEPVSNPDSQAAEAEPVASAPRVDYELLACEWVELHVMELNSRCNECIANGDSELAIPASELPDPQCWEYICRELVSSGIKECYPTDEGIKINLKQKNCRKE